MEIEEIRELIATLEKSPLHKFVWKKGDEEVRLEKAPPQPVSVSAAPPTISPQASIQEKPQETPAEKKGKKVISPMVGTFYTAAGPGSAPFVKVGDRVDEETIVCIVEAMKVMNEVKAGIKGEIVDILVDDMQPVEFGTPLFRVV